MPDLNITEELKRAIDDQPERKAPYFLSRNKTAGILMTSELERRSLTRSKPKTSKKHK